MTFAPQSSFPLRRLPAWILAILLVAAGTLEAQNRQRLRTDTPFHADPNGTQLGTLSRGLPVTLGRTSGAWREVTFEAWIFTASIGPANRPGFTHQVNVVNGENLRASRDGDLVGRAVQGTQLTQLGREGGWTRFRRTAWVPASAVQAPQQAAARPPARTGTATEPRAPAVETPPPPPPPPVARPPEERGDPVIVRRGATLSTGPGGETVGVTPDELPARMTGRQGNWVRVRTETWVREEDVRPRPADSNGITLERLREEPERFVGEPVIWRLQFISLREADELRPELPPGQPYVLARGPLPESGFVYVALRAGQVERFRRMNPLDEFVARGTIRAARTRFLPTPVVELSDQ